MGGCTESDERPSLSESVEKLAHRADSRGAAGRASHLRAVAEHLRAKDARKVRQVTVDVRPEALARHRRRTARAARLRGGVRGALRALGRRVRRLVTR